MFRLSCFFGFSLIELMIVVSIIGILAAIAIPSYQLYTERARFTEVMNTAEFYKIAVSLALQQGAPLAEIVNGAYSIPPEPKRTKNLASLTVRNGIIYALGTVLVKDSTYILTPNEDGTVWTVSGTCLMNGLCHA